MDEIMKLQGVQKAGNEEKEQERTYVPTVTSGEMLEDYVNCAKAYRQVAKNTPEPAINQVLREQLHERKEELIQRHGERQVRTHIKERLESLVYSYGCLACGDVPQKRYACGKSMEGYPVTMAKPMLEEAGILLKLSNTLDKQADMLMLGELVEKDRLQFLQQAKRKYGQ